MDKDLKQIIPPEFWRGNPRNNRPTAKCVGDLIEILQRLPAGLPITSPYAPGEDVTVMVVNISEADPHAVLMEDW